MSKESIFKEIRTVRTAQDKQWGGYLHDNSHTKNDWATYITEHTTKALARGDERFRKQMIKVAALAVAAVEALDRRT